MMFLLCDMRVCFFFFFFKQKTAYEMRISDWSSDVCSSDLGRPGYARCAAEIAGQERDRRQRQEISLSRHWLYGSRRCRADMACRLSERPSLRHVRAGCGSSRGKGDRKGDGEGKGESVGVDLVGRRDMTKRKQNK